MAITTQQELQAWRREVQRVHDRLDAIENVERAILREIGCPTDIVALYDFLASGETPWRKRDAERNLQRARYALHALIAVRDVRSSLTPDRDAAALDAIASLRLQTLAGDVVIAKENATIGARRRRTKTAASAKAAKQRTTKTRTRGVEIDKAAREYSARNPTHSDRAKAMHIAAKLKIPFGTVRRHLASQKKIRSYESGPSPA